MSHKSSYQTSTRNWQSCHALGLCVHGLENRVYSPQIETIDMHCDICVLQRKLNM